MTIVDEMEDFDNYLHLKKIEFYEFLGRFAELLYEGDQQLVDKLARLLDNLLTKIAKQKIQFRDQKDSIESESDDEDDVIESIKEKLLKKKSKWLWVVD